MNVKITYREVGARVEYEYIEFEFDGKKYEATAEYHYAADGELHDIMVFIDSEDFPEEHEEAVVQQIQDMLAGKVV